LDLRVFSIFRLKKPHVKEAQFGSSPEFLGGIWKAIAESVLKKTSKMSFSNGKNIILKSCKNHAKSGIFSLL